MNEHTIKIIFPQYMIDNCDLTKKEYDISILLSDKTVGKWLDFTNYHHALDNNATILKSKSLESYIIFEKWINYVRKIGHNIADINIKITIDNIEIILLGAKIFEIGSINLSNEKDIDPIFEVLISAECSIIDMKK